MNTGARLPVYKPEANKESKNNAQLALDLFAAHLVQLSDVKANVLISAMNNRLQHDREQISQLEKRQADLSSIYNQYLDIQAQIHAHEQSIDKIEGLIAPSLYGTGAYTEAQSESELEDQYRAKELRRRLQLWEAIEQYLRFVPDRESRVREILDFLELVEFDCSRQSVEAAIKAHPKVFRVQKRKNEKYISLKGA